MKVQHWIFSVRFWPEGAPHGRRAAVVGPARASTVEAALRLAAVPEDVRKEICTDETVRKFVEAALDPEASGHYVPCPFPTDRSWVVCIGPVNEVLS